MISITNYFSLIALNKRYIIRETAKTACPINRIMTDTVKLTFSSVI